MSGLFSVRVLNALVFLLYIPTRNLTQFTNFKRKQFEMADWFLEWIENFV